ncbi:MAG: C2 family cysteine protease, partial [Candidatus Sericytochromatia bacterium]
QNKLETDIKNNDFVGLISSLKDANNDIYNLVRNDTFPKFSRKVHELNTSVSNSINTQPIQQRLGEIDKQIQSLNGKSDLSSVIKLEKLNNMKQELKNNFLPSLDINDPKSLSEALTKFKELTATKSSFTSKPSLLRGDINTVYKAFDNLVKESQKNPPDGMAKLQALFNLEKEVKNFIQKNPDSGKIAVIKAFSENLAPLTEIKHTTHDQANPNGDFELPKTPQVKVKTPINHSTNGNLVITDDIPKISAKPGVKANLTKDITIKNKAGEDVVFKKGEKCVVIEKDSKLYLQKIERKKDAEKGDLDEFQVKHELLPIDDPKLVKASQSFTKTNDKLFPKEISVRDIKQGAIGDCYLIAGLYSITATDPNAIYNMIKDNDDGTVTVKMFDFNKKTEKFEPKFITFEKSTLNSNEKAEDTLWVQMLEKAYAIHNGSYESIGKGGHSNEVFEAFTGIKSNRNDIKLSSLIDLKSDISPKYKPTDENANKIQEIIESLNEKALTERQKESLKIITDGKCKNVSEIKEILVNDLGVSETDNTNISKINRLAFNNEHLVFNSFIDSSPSYIKISGKSSPTIEDAEIVINELKEKFKGVEQFQGHSVSEFINKLEIYSKDNFNKLNEYTNAEKKIFQGLKNSLDSGKLVAVGTKKNIGQSQGKGHSGGESMVDGLAGQHAYSVLDTVEMNGKMFVKIGNPWGNEFSRDYVMKDGELVSREFNKRDYSYLPSSDKKKGAGIEVNESWIELKDLTKNFNNIYYQN